MVITLCAIVAALLIGFFTQGSLVFHTLYLATLLLTGGTVILLATFFLKAWSLAPLVYLEQKLTPHLVELVQHDYRLRLSRYFLWLFALASFICAGVLATRDIPYPYLFFLVWIIAFGGALDLLRYSGHRLANFLNPSYLIKQLTQEAKKAIQNAQDERLWSNLDSLAEMGFQSIEKSKLALSTQVLQTFPPIMQTFYTSSKSISRINRDQAIERETGRDEASYTIFYLLQRLELMNDKALERRLETVCRQMIMTLGKIIVYSAKFDLSMVSFPTHFLTKFGLKAQQHHFDEIAVLTTSTLLEIAKTILTEVDLTYAELQEPFQAIINGLDALAKGTFKKDKTTSIKVLTQPFLELKDLFETDKMANHRDTPIVVQEINRVLEEFAALEQVLRTIPPISGISGRPPTDEPPLPPTET